MNSDIDDLSRAVRDKRVILFAGAGVSMSVGLPSWQRLISHMADELGIDLAEVAEHSRDYQTLAEFYLIMRGSIGPLRSWMDREWKVANEKVQESRVHRLIVELDFPIIYTTNYDRNLEAAFEVHDKPFVKIASARDIARELGSATQIVKFHGDFEDETSLVLTESDYFSRLSFDSPLDIKFRAESLGRTVLFIGYSMQDLNIRLLLYKLWEVWNRSGQERDRPKLYIFMPRPDPVQDAVLGRWGITLIGGTGNDPEEALCAFLEQLKAWEADR